jgi:hypothetical protein
MEIQFWKNNRMLPVLVFIISILAYYGFAYRLERTDYLELSVLYTALFASYYYLVSRNKEEFTFLAVLSILFRLVFILAIPNLSQDFYRFIWDGRMILEGLNPYLFTPDSIVENGQVPIAQAQELLVGMGSLSAGNFTNYPPVNQLCFVIANLLSANSILGSVIAMHILILLADVGTLFIGKKLLEKFNIPVHHIFWYILSPFVIIELTGNLHFEGVMVFFLLLSIYLLHTNRWKMAAVFFALSVSIKLIPLIFIPLLFQKLGCKKWLWFSTIVGGVSALLFLPFLSQEFLVNYANTVGLWFQKFEFNASIYYLLREVGYTFRGYNEIAIIGFSLSIVVLLVVIAMSIFRKNVRTLDLITSMLFALVFFFFTTTTMHPWYLVTPLLLSIFTKYRFVLVWSFVIFLSYFAYLNGGNQENLWIIFFEYLIVYGVLIFELYSYYSIKKSLP